MIETYCKFCQCIKRNRMKHCYSCGKCVMKHDHHCPWIGACVGELNHFMFVMCLFAHTCQAVTTFYIVCFLVYYERFSNRYIFISTTTHRQIRSVRNMACTCYGLYLWSCTFCSLGGCLCSISILYWLM